MPWICSPLYVAACLGISVASAHAQQFNFTDGFEGGQLDPFWQVHDAGGGSATVSTDSPHWSGQSLKLTNPNGKKGIQIAHDFDAPQYGRVSVWVYDNAAGVKSSNFLNLTVNNLQTGESWQIYTSDYDLGEGHDGSTYFYYADGGSHASSVDRTTAWHLWQVEATSTGVHLTVDDTVIYSNSSTAGFDSLSIDMHAPDWRPGWTGYFDDFDITSRGIPCGPDFNDDGVLDLFDFLAFMNDFNAGC